MPDLIVVVVVKSLVDPEHSFREASIICGQRPPTSSNGTLGRFVIYVIHFPMGKQMESVHTVKQSSLT